MNSAKNSSVVIAIVKILNFLIKTPPGLAAFAIAYNFKYC
jgi:hypothetical protein